MTESVPITHQEQVYFEEKLLGLVAALGMEASVDTKADGAIIYFNLSGRDEEFFLEQKAEPLRSMSILMQTLFDKRNPDSEIQLKVDACRHLREKEDGLRQMAFNACEQLTEPGQEVKLEPLNPYDRRIVHMALQDNTQIETHSVGNGHFKQLVVRRLS